MTITELRKKPIGVLMTRSFTMKHNWNEYQETYFLGKCSSKLYFIGFSSDGYYCCQNVDEKTMAELINDEQLSSRFALDIFMLSPQLSCYLDD